MSAVNPLEPTAEDIARCRAHLDDDDTITRRDSYVIATSWVRIHLDQAATETRPTERDRAIRQARAMLAAQQDWQPAADVDAARAVAEMQAARSEPQAGA